VVEDKNRRNNKHVDRSIVWQHDRLLCVNISQDISPHLSTGLDG
jgi:hypothetical protein